MITAVNDTTFTRTTAAVASVGAGFIHLAAYPTHLREWLPSGLFFAGIASFQLAWAAAVAFSSRRDLLVLGLLANAGSLGLWAVSRTWGMPAGPTAGTPEPVGLADTLTVVLEITVIAAALCSLRRRHPRAAFSRLSYRFAVSGIALLAAAVTAPGMLAAFQHSHAPVQDHDGTHDERRSNSGHRDQQPRRDSTIPPTPQTHPETHGGGGHTH